MAMKQSSGLFYRSLKTVDGRVAEWYTLTTQNRAPQGLRVQVPPRPPTVFKIVIMTQNRMAQALRVQVPPPAQNQGRNVWCPNPK